MPDTSTSNASLDATRAAIQALAAELGHYPSPVDVAAKLGISRQLLHWRLKALEQAGTIERLNHGHVLRVVDSEPRS